MKYRVYKTNNISDGNFKCVFSAILFHTLFFKCRFFKKKPNMTLGPGGFLDVRF